MACGVTDRIAGMLIFHAVGAFVSPASCVQPGKSQRQVHRIFHLVYTLYRFVAAPGAVTDFNTTYEAT